jgi:methyl-accepting chemotaxis protein
MKIRGRLLTSFLAASLIPLVLLTVVNYRNSTQSSKEISSHAVEGLTNAAQDRLVAIRSLKQTEIQDYFQTISSQVTSFAEDASVIDALHQFTEGFATYNTEMTYDTAALKQLRNEVKGYYSGTFSREYETQNPNLRASAEGRSDMLGEESIALQNSYIVKNANPLGSKHKLDTADVETTYGKTHSKYHPVFRNFLERFAYYDIFLIDSKSGNVVYSVFKELDFATNLVNGPYASSNFAEAFRQANQASSPGSFLVDFANYYPSYEAPASFIAAPIFENGEKIGVVAFQMPTDRINLLMGSRDGMGKTGESYLVGSDFLPRSNSVMDPTNRSIVAAFRNPKEGSIRTQAIERALRGETDIIEATNYLGQQTMTAFAPVALLGLKWAIVTEIGLDEALLDAHEIQDVSAASQASQLLWSGIIAISVTMCVLAFAYWTVNSLVRPINATVQTLRDIAEGEGDLTRTLNESRTDELGELAHWFNVFVKRIHDLVAVISKDANMLTHSSKELTDTAAHLSHGASESKNQSATVSAAAEEMSINMKNVAESTDGMSHTIRNVAASVEEMNQTIREIAKNAEKSATVANEAANLVEVSNSKISNLGSAADEIGKVIEVIQDIAEQTNLLALNATIEAARAGEAGKGFAVVATEVKELAKQTAAATDDIRARIEAMQASTGEAVDSIKAISDVIKHVNEVSRTIASAVEEQSITTRQISDNVTTTASAAESVARGVQETATASMEITQNISRVDQVLHQTASGADQSRDAGQRLLDLAQEMQGLIGRFRVNNDEPTSYHSHVS